MDDACKINQKTNLKLRASHLKFHKFTYKFHIAPQILREIHMHDVNFKIRPTLKFHLLPKIYH